jgi:hypothetical protein
VTTYKRKSRHGDRWHYRKQFQLPDGSTANVAGTPAINTKTAAEAAERAHVERVLNPMGVRFDDDVSGRCDGCASQYRGDVISLDDRVRIISAGMSVYIERLPGQRKRWRMCMSCWHRVEALLRSRGGLSRAIDDLALDQDDFPERIEAHLERMRSKFPHMKFTKTDAARALLHKALSAEEQQAKKAG